MTSPRYEYRVTWRRANARRLRTRRYATLPAAQEFAEWLALDADERINDSELGRNLAELGPAVDITLTRRRVGPWEAIV